MNKFFSSALVLLLALSLSACADKMFSDSDQDQESSSSIEQSDAPRQGKLRHPGLMGRATTQEQGVAGKYGAQNAHLFLAFAEYEADGVTRRVMDAYGVTRRILQEYGVTRRILQEYGVTRRILEEYGVTRRVIEQYGELTWELLEEHGITRRIADQYGVTRRILEEYEETYEPAIELRVRINRARPGITIVFGSDLLEVFLDEISDDEDIELIEPDAEFEGAPLYLREGFGQSGQMVPWNLASVGGVFTTFQKDDVDIFLLDSGVYGRDLNIVEAKDFTMLFENRHEETWDDENVIEMAFFDPGDMGDPVDHNGHGTHGAGTIGAKNNSEGIKGMAPEARIHSLKVLTDDGRTDITTVVSALDYVTDFKQQNPTKPVVVNMSLGMDLESTSYNILDEAVRRSIEFGVVVVVSAGNDAADASTYSPAHVYEAITVGAYDRNDEIAAFSNYGSTIDLFAPGDAVVSLTHLESEADNDDNVLLSGTSSAAPHVAAAAALYLVQNPYASPADVKQALINASEASVTGVPGGTTNRALRVGFAADGETKPFEVTKSEWTVNDSGVHKFKVEGEGPRLDVVSIFNAGRGNELAELTIDEEGKWKYQVTEPSTVPCFVDVSYHGGVFDAADERHEVLSAPGSCEPLPTLTKAEWKDDEELVIEGEAIEGFQVVLRDVQLGTILAEVTADDHNDFEFVTTALSGAPCRVSATVGDESVELEVNNADEDDCSAGMGMNRPVSILKAEYDSQKHKLKIEGDTNPGAEVTLRSLVSLNVVGTDVASNNGSFKYEEAYPPIIPCVVLVEAPDGSTAQANVVKKGTTQAPGDCERSLTVENVEWNASNQELKFKARGLFGNDVVFRNARNGEIFHTATFDNKGKAEDNVSGLAHIPCAVVVESQEVSLMVIEAEVTNAPSNCDVDLVFNLAQYSSLYNRLSAGGRATGGSTVVLTNPGNGTPIVDVAVADDGTWRVDLTLNASGSVPSCSIQAVADNGSVQTATVAAGSCTSDFTYVADEVAWEQNPYSFIELSRADFNNTAQTLRVSGNGYEFMEITVVNPLNGDVLGSMTNDDTPAFDFMMDITGTIPCAIVAELDGRTADRIVSNTPDNCDDRPFLNMARWNNGQLEIDAIGGKNFDLALSSVGRGQFAEGSFGGNSSFSASFAPADLEWIPCEVEMTSNEQSMTLPVNGAPAYCDGTPVILLSKWANGQLMLTAQGGFREPVTVTAPGTGEVMAAGAFDNNGMFSVAVPASGLDYVPCSTDFTTDGMTASRTVDSAPAHCEGQLQVSLAKWTGSALNLRVYGSFNSRIQVWAADGQRLNGSATAHDFQLGADGYADVFLSGEDMDFIPGAIELEYERNAGQGYVGQLPATVASVPVYTDGTIFVDQANWNNGSLIIEAFGPFDARGRLFATDGQRLSHLANGTDHDFRFGSNGSVSLSLSGSDLDFIPSAIRFETERRSDGGDFASVTVPVGNLPDHIDGTPNISLARWNAGYMLFEAEGPFNGDFQLSSTQRPGEIIYAGNFGPTGVVELSLSGADGLPFVPSELLVEYRPRPTAAEFSSLAVPVMNAPAHADGEMELLTVEWDDELIFEAWGSYNEVLTLSSVADGRVIGTVQTDELGYFDGVVLDLPFVPCSVLVTSEDSRTAQLAVDGAPFFCDDTAWLNFSKAAYDPGRQRLVLEGEGFGRDGATDAEVGFFFASGANAGQAFHTEIMDGGEWAIQLENVESTEVACAVTVRLQNADEITLPVERAPASCQ